MGFSVVAWLAGQAARAALDRLRKHGQSLDGRLSDAADHWVAGLSQDLDADVLFAPLGNEEQGASLARAKVSRILLEGKAPTTLEWVEALEERYNQLSLDPRASMFFLGPLDEGKSGCLRVLAGKLAEACVADPIRAQMTTVENSAELLKRTLANRAAQPERVVLDMGDVFPPSSDSPTAEVRVTLTSLRNSPVKLRQLRVSIVSAQQIADTIGLDVAAPVPQRVLRGRLGPAVDSVDLLPSEHILHFQESDGFRIMLDAEEGYEYNVVFIAQWHDLGGQEIEESTSPGVVLRFPTHSREGLRRLRSMKAES